MNDCELTLIQVIPALNNSPRRKAQEKSCSLNNCPCTIKFTCVIWNHVYNRISKEKTNNQN